MQMILSILSFVKSFGAAGFSNERVGDVNHEQDSDAALPTCCQGIILIGSIALVLALTGEEYDEEDDGGPGSDDAESSSNAPCDGRKGYG